MARDPAARVEDAEAQVVEVPQTPAGEVDLGRGILDHQRRTVDASDLGKDEPGDDGEGPGTQDGGAAVDVIAEVQQHLGDKQVRCVCMHPTDGMVRGMQARDTDQGCYGLITDLKQRGLLEDTLVIWGGEFGRTVYSQGAGGTR